MRRLLGIIVAVLEKYRHLHEEPRPSGAGPEVRAAAVAACVAALVLWGALCMAAGAMMQAAGTPFWTRHNPDSPTLTLASAVLAAPAGWVCATALSVPAVVAVHWGWQLARSADRKKEERRQGALVALGAGAGLLLWLAGSFATI